ncbi:uncharacterized protein [Palaemon carinicauda]|uniref:uncharacterized protein n=1 Tax=Palaemon carinicauda TaxID=392227 RepID=UPI0035B67D9F
MRGVGAALLQNGQPVAYASESLSQTESNYSNIEREKLGVVFGLNRFHHYVYGHPVIVETDHKPLESIAKRGITQAPLRLMRMLLWIQPYSYFIWYKPGKEVCIADALSRMPVQGQEIQDVNITIYVIRNMSWDRLEAIKSATTTDVELTLLKEMSNGKAERFVGTVERTLTKAVESNGDPTMALVCLRTTPIEAGEPLPSELFYVTKMISNLAICSEPVTLRERTCKWREHYKKSAKQLPELSEGQDVRMMDQRNKCWIPAKVQQRREEPRSYDVISHNRVKYRRNRRHLRTTGEKFQFNTDTVPEDVVDDQINAPVNNTTTPKTMARETPLPDTQSQGTRYSSYGRLIKTPDKLNLAIKMS